MSAIGGKPFAVAEQDASAVGDLDQLTRVGLIDVPLANARNLCRLGFRPHVKSPVLVVMVGCHRQAARTTPRRRPLAFRHLSVAVCPALMPVA